MAPSTRETALRVERMGIEVPGVKYRHIHHAGNFADTLKHLVLVELLEALKRKPAPLVYLDTHAGRGSYALPPPPERDGTEFSRGFGRLDALSRKPAALERYVTLINALGQSNGHLSRYPGSPAIAVHLLREGDRALLYEAQAAEAAALQKLLGRRRNVLVRCEDGYRALKSQLPPPERRGLVFIDPPYEEQEHEFATLLTSLRTGLERWPTGVYAAWYPIKREAPVRRFHDSLVQLAARRVLVAQLTVFPTDSRASLNGCGVAVINTPWQVDQSLADALPALHRALGGRSATGPTCKWLVPG